jgi:hypothetical protein
MMMGRARLVAVIAAACAVVTAAAIAYAAGQASAPEVMQAQRFELVDSEGKVKAVLGVRKQGSIVHQVTVLGPREHTTEETELVVSGGGAELPYLELKDEEGRTRVEVTFDRAGDPAILMKDGQGKVVFAAPLEFGVEMLAR